MNPFDRPDLLAIAGITALIVAGPREIAAENDAHAAKARQTADEIQWPAPSFVAQPGAKPNPTLQSTVVRGDANKHELYSIMFKAGPNTKLTAHSHPDERSCFVLAGVWYFGYGEKWDVSALKALPAGSRYTEPADAPHFAGTKDEEAVVECTAVGPSGTKALE